LLGASGPEPDLLIDERDRLAFDGAARESDYSRAIRAGRGRADARFGAERRVGLASRDGSRAGVLEKTLAVDTFGHAGRERCSSRGSRERYDNPNDLRRAAFFAWSSRCEAALREGTLAAGERARWNFNACLRAGEIHVRL